MNIELTFCITLLIALLIIMVRGLLIGFRGLRRHGKQTEENYKNSSAFEAQREKFKSRLKK